jgi:hypothetical protein
MKCEYKNCKSKATKKLKSIPTYYCDKHYETVLEDLKEMFLVRNYGRTIQS